MPATEGTAGVPLLDGVIARFTCRNVRNHDGGDHVIFIGEVERFETFDAEPLVFHSGFYRVATRHPEARPGLETASWATANTASASAPPHAAPATTSLSQWAWRYVRLQPIAAVPRAASAHQSRRRGPSPV